MNRFFKAALAGALVFTLSAPALAAQSYRIDFDLANWFPNYTGSDGSFVATDANDDGMITFSEVISFRNNGLGEGTLLAFGDFDLAQDQWSSSTDPLYEGQYYVLTKGLQTYYVGIQPEARVTALAVPEPANLSLMFLGLGQFAAALRRRGRQSGE